MKIIIAIEQLQQTGSQFFFFRTHAGAEIDLIVDRGGKKIGYEFKSAISINKRDWLNLKNGIADGIINKGFVVYLGERGYPVADKIHVVGASELLLDIF